MHPENDGSKMAVSAKLTRNDVAGLSLTKLVEMHSTKTALMQSRRMRVIATGPRVAFE